MQPDGLLSSRQVIVDGRARRLYTITDTGRQELASQRHALAEVAREGLAIDYPVDTENTEGRGSR